MRPPAQATYTTIYGNTVDTLSVSKCCLARTRNTCLNWRSTCTTCIISEYRVWRHTFPLFLIYSLPADSVTRSPR